MSLQIFSKNLKYLKKKSGLTQVQIVSKVNKLLQKELKHSEDKEINLKRVGAYMEGRSYCPAYILPLLCRVLGVRDSLSLFRDDIEKMEKGTCTTI